MLPADLAELMIVNGGSEIELVPAPDLGLFDLLRGQFPSYMWLGNHRQRQIGQCGCFTPDDG
jgi:hypothetical protein